MAKEDSIFSLPIWTGKHSPQIMQLFCKNHDMVEGDLPALFAKKLKVYLIFGPVVFFNKSMLVRKFRKRRTVSLWKAWPQKMAWRSAHPQASLQRPEAKRLYKGLA